MQRPVPAASRIASPMSDVNFPQRHSPELPRLRPSPLLLHGKVSKALGDTHGRHGRVAFADVRDNLNHS